MLEYLNQNVVGEMSKFQGTNAGSVGRTNLPRAEGWFY